MTDTRMKNTLNVYETIIARRIGDLKNPALYYTLWREEIKDLKHLLEMIPKAIGFIDEGKIEKANRWLGFIQGVLWVHKVFTLEELKNHNRTPKCEFEEPVINCPYIPEVLEKENA